jgi:hypothetical protein
MPRRAVPHSAFRPEPGAPCLVRSAAGGGSFRENRTTTMDGPAGRRLGQRPELAIDGMGMYRSSIFRAGFPVRGLGQMKASCRVARTVFLLHFLQ